MFVSSGRLCRQEWRTASVVLDVRFREFQINIFARTSFQCYLDCLAFRFMWWSLNYRYCTYITSVTEMEDLIKYQGGCHCGAILFEVWAPKGGLISERFHFGANLQKYMPNHSPKDLFFRRVICHMFFETWVKVEHFLRLSNL